MRRRKKRKLQLDELEEIRGELYESSKLYKACVKAFHDSRIIQKQFIVGNKVLLYDSRLHLLSGKLQSCWIGPYIVKKVYPHGAVEIEDPTNGTGTKVNGQQLKPFLEGFNSLLESIRLEDSTLGGE